MIRARRAHGHNQPSRLVGRRNRTRIEAAIHLLSDRFE